MPRTWIAGALAAGLFVLALGPAAAGPELVNFPADYKTRFVLYNTIDRPDLKQVRFVYANPEVVKAAQPATDLPSGAVLVMENRRAKVDDKGEVVFGPDGGLIPTEEIAAVFVQEKRTGWGAAYPAEWRNGTWEYAAFAKDGARSTTVTNFEPCFKCHTSRAHRDYNFTFNKWVIDGKR